MKTLTYGIGATLCLSLLACDPSAPELAPQDSLAAALTTTGPVTIPLPDPCLTSTANATADLGAYSSQVQSQGQMPPPPLSLPGTPTIVGCTAYVAEFTVGAGSLAPPNPPGYAYDPVVQLSGAATFNEGFFVNAIDCGKLRGQIDILQQKSGTTSFTLTTSGIVKGLWSGGRCTLDKTFPIASFYIPASGVDKYRVKLNATIGGIPVPVTATMTRKTETVIH